MKRAGSSVIPQVTKTFPLTLEGGHRAQLFQGRGWLRAKPVRMLYFGKFWSSGGRGHCSQRFGAGGAHVLPSLVPNSSLSSPGHAGAITSSITDAIFIQWKAGMKIARPGSPYIAGLPHADAGLGFLWLCQGMSRDRCHETDSSVCSFMSNLSSNTRAQLRSNASTGVTQHFVYKV